ncbi:MAG: NgoMIV family type II restriction endonuclease, partial [Chloroflexota bacterium]|nr:NgoMIV family type II restriction endonuclease [Chloroflexota bacterium]
MSDSIPLPSIWELRSRYQREICSNIFGASDNSGVLSIADKSSRASITIAAGMAAAMGHPLATRPLTSQAAADQFTAITHDFLVTAFQQLGHIRPGQLAVSTSHASLEMGSFDQYEHLVRLSQVLSQNPELSAALDNDYLIAPNIVISREALTDDEINAKSEVILQVHRAATL